MAFFSRMLLYLTTILMTQTHCWQLKQWFSTTIGLKRWGCGFFFFLFFKPTTFHLSLCIPHRRLYLVTQVCGWGEGKPAVVTLCLLEVWSDIIVTKMRFCPVLNATNTCATNQPLTHRTGYQEAVTLLSQMLHTLCNYKSRVTLRLHLSALLWPGTELWLQRILVWVEVAHSGLSL